MNLKEQTRQLWERCFNDPEDFTDLYFRTRYTESENLVIREKQQLAAAMQLIPYPMNFEHSRIQTAYISGACTHPDFRNQGIMRRLLQQSFRHMQQQHIQLACLIPAENWLFDYYAQSGFEPVFQYSIRAITSLIPTKPDSSVRIRTVNHFEEAVYQYLSHRLSLKAWCIQHSKADFEVIMEDLTCLNSGTILTAEQNSMICGIIIAYHRPEGICIETLEAENPAIGSLLTNALLEQIPQNTSCFLYQPASNFTQNHPLGMARIIDAPGLLSLYAQKHPTQTLEIRLEDRDIPSNSGLYRIEQGKITVDKQEYSPHTPFMDSRALCRFLLADKYPQMSLMLN